MASERQCAANRANAKKSTGPKSRAGKMRSSWNAYRHGLSAPPLADAAWTTGVDRLAREIVDSMGGAIDFARAHVIAAAQLEVERARAPISAICAQILAHANNGGQPAVSAMRASAITGSTTPAEETFESMAHTLRTLKRLNRYLHRALARRDRSVIFTDFG
jgi:hypothetical protein